MSASDALASNWMVDADRLRETLDALQAALPGSPRAFSATTGALDGGRLSTVIHDFFDQLTKVDLRARSALSGVVREYRQPEQAARLHDLLERLQSAWTARIAAHLTEPERRALAGLMSAGAPDLLGIFAKGSDENAHSDALRWLLDPRMAPTIAPGALHRLVARFEDAPRWQEPLGAALRLGLVTVRREYVIGREWTGEGEMDRIDLLISGPGFVIAIENKIWSAEHSAQTETYWQWLAAIGGLRAGIFLTPAGYSPSCPSFQPMSYLDCLACLLEAPGRGAELMSEERVVLSSYVRSLAEHVLRTELRALPPT